MNREQIERMQLVYGDDDTELTVLLDESLAPRSPDFLVDLALPLLTPQSRLLDVSNGLGRLSVGRYCSDRCLTAARALLALADAEPIGASREARQRRAAAVVLLRAWRSRGGPEPSEVVDAIERTTKTLYV